MKLTRRAYQNEDDYWRLREFLRRTFLLSGRREFNWHVSTLDYIRRHVYQNILHVRLEEVCWIWETTAGEVAACALPIDPGSVHFQAHPELRTPGLEEEMLDLVEQRLAETKPDGSRRLEVWAFDEDDLRTDLLARRGYQRGEWPEVIHRRWLAQPIPAAPVAAGYTVRALGDGLELLERCYASGLGFHEGDIRIAVDNRNNPGWYHDIQELPLYRRDLDIVAVATDGSIAAFCTAWFDDVTRSGVFEPVATVPAHQRRGLGRAVITEGLRRLQRLGAVVASVGGFSQAANALYAATLPDETQVYARWAREWDLSTLAAGRP